MSPCAARSSRATMSIAPTCPPCALNNTSFFTPARATPAPISFHMRISVSADSVSVPAKRACSGLRPICWVGRNSTGSAAGSSGSDAATMPSASTVSTPSGRCGPVLLGGAERQHRDGGGRIERREIARGELGPEAGQGRGLGSIHDADLRAVIQSTRPATARLSSRHKDSHMDLQLQDQHVLITGGSKGIGLACALGFLREGARVSLVSRDLQNLEQGRKTLLEALAQAEGRVSVHAADLKDPPAPWPRSMRPSRPSGLSTCSSTRPAPRAAPRPTTWTAAAWHDAMDAKYFTYIHMIDPVVKRMGARGRGAIVNVIGQGGKVASPVHMAGGAANAALMLVSAGMAAAYAGQGVRVNAVNPGLTLTERLQEGMKADAKLRASAPTRRWSARRPGCRSGASRRRKKLRTPSCSWRRRRRAT
jgi:NAD(P)-dependent dehydrogenase (short-subunit alcohol dehydrogenase family)